MKSVYVVVDDTMGLKAIFDLRDDALDFVIASTVQGNGVLTYSPISFERPKFQPYRIMRGFGDRFEEIDMEGQIKLRLEEVGIVR